MPESWSFSTTDSRSKAPMAQGLHPTEQQVTIWPGVLSPHDKGHPEAPPEISEPSPPKAPPSPLGPFCILESDLQHLFLAENSISGKMDVTAATE